MVAARPLHNRSPVLLLDVPSGLGSSSGAAGRPTVWTDATLTLALPKVELMSESARPFVGNLYLADISIRQSCIVK